MGSGAAGGGGLRARIATRFAIWDHSATLKKFGEKQRQQQNTTVSVGLYGTIDWVLVEIALKRPEVDAIVGRTTRQQAFICPTNFKPSTIRQLWLRAFPIRSHIFIHLSKINHSKATLNDWSQVCDRPVQPPHVNHRFGQSSTHCFFLLVELNEEASSLIWHTCRWLRKR